MKTIVKKWHRRLAHDRLPEVFAVIIGLGSGAYGTYILATPYEFTRIISFQAAFTWFPPYVWGLFFILPSLAMLTLLIHSRFTAAIPIFILGFVWMFWVFPILLSPGFALSAVIIYFVFSLVTQVTGLACLVPREDYHATSST